MKPINALASLDKKKILDCGHPDVSKGDLWGLWPLEW
jgi:hypothetical protein